jgi:NitT/TauT family transport system substrate-binding protein
VADSVPSEYHLGDKPLYLKAVKNSLPTYSRDGISPKAGQESVLDMLRKLDPELGEREDRPCGDRSRSAS